MGIGDSQLAHEYQDAILSELINDTDHYDLGLYAAPPTHALSATSSGMGNDMAAPRPTTDSMKTSQPNAAQTPSASDDVVDLILLSKDCVWFTVHSSVLLTASTNKFSNLIPPRDDSASTLSIVSVDEDSVVMYLMIDASYLSTATSLFIPPQNFDWIAMVDIASLKTAVGRLAVYGLPTDIAAHTSSVLYQRLREEIPRHPLDVFALAAHHGLEEFTVQASSHLLSLPLINVSDEQRQYMGSSYYDRLVALHEKRLLALVHILLRPPSTHMADLLCTEENQNQMVQSWIKSAALVLIDATPSSIQLCLSAVDHSQCLLLDLSANYIVGLMKAYSTSQRTDCPQCSISYSRRLSEVADEWMKIGVSLHNRLLLCG